jgi:hypothetical protein
MARRSGSSKRRGPSALQIVTWVIVFLVVVSMVLSTLPLAYQ